MVRDTTYKIAVNFLHNDFVMCNNLPEIDPSVWENMRSPLSYEDEDGEHDLDIFQWFITSASQGDVEYLEKSFKLHFTYSDLLDCFVLCVTHWGTSWSGVHWECYNDDISDKYLKDEDEF